jgi:hypothetical protein
MTGPGCRINGEDERLSTNQLESQQDLYQHCHFVSQNEPWEIAWGEVLQFLLSSVSFFPAVIQKQLLH